MDVQALQVFQFRNAQVRTVVKDDEPWFVAKDVCSILGIQNSRDAIIKGLDLDEKDVEEIDTPGGRQRANIINESGLYALIVRSDKPEAKTFRKWVTSEVLPQIRKTGKYEITQIKTPASFAEALKLAYEQQLQIEHMAPKVEAFDAFLDVKNCMTMNQVAKTLETGRNRLFEFLRNEGILMSSGANFNLPAQRYADEGYFTVRQITIPHSDWSETKSQTLVTAKGLEYIRKKLIDSVRASSI